jgi:radical SAM superfamily enzyme YgiQ (UPF0313 family)
MNLLLVSPCPYVGRKRPKVLKLPQLSLNILASLTPSDVDITIIDEERDKIDFSMDYDLVGITSMTATANRAYQLADIFREKGSKVVLGGIHPTVLPQEAIQHADAVVIGEAEGCWGDVIEDSRRGELKKFYHVPNPDLSNYPHPKRDIHFAKSPLNAIGLMTTRGCPYDCDFCSVATIYGKKVRHRDISLVVDDIEKTGSKFFFILDDNITGHPEYSKKLFEALIPLNISWAGQSSISLAKDKEMLELCRKSGCIALFFGLESVSPLSLMGMKKTMKSIEENEEAIKIIHDSGIAFHPSLVLGFDTDTKAVFDDTLQFLERNKVPSMHLSILTPYPGTRIYQRFKDEGRLIIEDWGYYDHNTVVFQPKNMTQDELTEGFYHVKKEFYSMSSILKHVPSLLSVSPVNIKRVLFFILFNFANRNILNFKTFM